MSPQIHHYFKVVTTKLAFRFNSSCMALQSVSSRHYFYKFTVNIILLPDVGDVVRDRSENKTLLFSLYTLVRSLNTSSTREYRYRFTPPNSFEYRVSVILLSRRQSHTCRIQKKNCYLFLYKARNNLQHHAKTFSYS